MDSIDLAHGDQDTMAHSSPGDGLVVDVVLDRGPGKTTILNTAIREDPVMEILNNTGLEALHNSVVEDTTSDRVVAGIY